MNDFLTGSNSNLSTVIDRTIDKVSGATQTGQLARPDDRREGAGRGDAPARERVRRRRRARPAHRPRARHGVVADLRPEPRRNGLRSDPRAAGSVQAGGSLAQPRDVRALHPGIDVQGHHCSGGARLRGATSRARCSRTRATASSTARRSSTSPTRTAPRSSAGHARGGAPALDQRRLLRHRQGARPRADPRLRAALRLLQPSAARDARATSGSRAACTRTASSSCRTTRTTSTPAASPSVRSGCSRRRCRWRWSHRRSPTVACVMKPYVVDRILTPTGEILSKTAPEKLSTAVSPQTAAELTAMMRLVVEAGTGTAAQIPGVPVAGKTGTAETGNSGRERRLVHLVRTGRRAARRSRRRPLESGRHRRSDRSPDRPCHHRDPARGKHVA